jgi:hypothetical protein
MNGGTSLRREAASNLEKLCALSSLNGADAPLKPHSLGLFAHHPQAIVTGTRVDHAWTRL